MTKMVKIIVGCQLPTFTVVYVRSCFNGNGITGAFVNMQKAA